MIASLDPARGARIAALGLCAAVLGLLAGINPKFAIAAAIAAGFVLLVAVDLAAGLAVFGFFSFLEVLELGSVISVGKLGGVLLALGWVAVLTTRHEARRDFLLVHPWIAGVLGLFLGWSLLSSAWSLEPGASLAQTGRLALNAVLFLIVFTAIRTRPQAALLAAAFVAGALAATAYGLSYGNVSAGTGRLTTGSGLDPNELASVLVAGLALSGALAVAMRGFPLRRLAATAAGAFCLVGLLLTNSRGGLVALGVALLAAIVLAGRWRAPVIAATGLILASAFLYLSTLASPEARERIAAVTRGESRLEDGRTTIWTVGWRMSEDNLLAGVGAGNFQHASPQFVLQPGALARTDQILVDAPKVAHNTYLGLLAELGVIGLALFLTIVGFSLHSLLRAAQGFRARGDRAGEALARGFAIALLATLAADFFISQEVNKGLWLLLGVGPALLSVSRDGGAAEQDGATAA